ncbi:MAG TPA: cytochrome C biosynthesis protein [Prolixibacteraceae bacterium]|nr:cytochrome C biosynthesis protein [Prolixibacteraceae bacterium]
MTAIIRLYKNSFGKLIFSLIVLSGFALSGLVSGCSSDSEDTQETNRVASIYPDYYDLTLPPNIAPLNFIINETATKFNIEITGQNGTPIKIETKNTLIEIPEKPWSKLLKANTGKFISIETSALKENNWQKFKPIVHKIAADTIDSHLVYRLVHATYLKWKDMGIYQRNLTNFDETPLIENSSTENGCMNCHSFAKNNPDKMMIHFRIVHPGTLIWNNGELTKTDTKTDKTMSAGVYPAWHPDGKHIAFSTGKISPHLTTRLGKPVDVADKASGIIVLNTETNTVITSPQISTNRRESMPEWSADGKYLYFVSAPEAQKGNEESLLHNRYSLMRIACDIENNVWGEAEMVLNADSIGKSISMPAVSPDGKFMVCSMSDFGYFTIFHQKSDLYFINLADFSFKKLELNSEYAESHSSWSVNSRWLVFSSKRADGVFTRPYIVYIDENGKPGNPLVLPQKNPAIYQQITANYNRPDLITGKVNLSPIQIRDVVLGEAEKVKVE